MASESKRAKEQPCAVCGAPRYRHQGEEKPMLRLGYHEALPDMTHAFVLHHDQRPADFTD